MAMRVTFTPSGFSSRARYSAVASPSTFGLVARMISSMLPFADAREQALDLQLVGADALQRRQRAHQHVIHALEVARLLDGRDILRLLDDADQRWLRVSDAQ